MQPKPTKSKSGSALMTISDVAESWGASEKTVRRAIEAGDLPVIRIGRLVRVDPEDNARFLRARKEG